MTRNEDDATREAWSLTTMSFKGTVAGAVHTYGVLSGAHGRHYKVCELLDKRTADELNEHATRVGKDWLTYEADEPNEFFMREEDLEECARVAFLFLAPPGSALLRGTAVDINPSKVIEAPQEVEDVLVPIWELDESETSTSWTDVRKDAAAQWEKAFKDLGLVEVGESYHPDANMRAIVDRHPGIVRRNSPCGYDASVTLESA